MTVLPTGRAVVETLFIMDALYDQDVIRFSATRHELSAACVADGYGRLTGQTGVALVTTGIGVTNLPTGVGGAVRDSGPSVLDACKNNNEDDAQAADHVSILRPLTKWATLATDAATIPAVVQKAFHVPARRFAMTGAIRGARPAGSLRCRPVVASVGRPGPVLVDLACDVFEEGRVPSEAVNVVTPIQLPRPAGAILSPAGVGR